MPKLLDFLKDKGISHEDAIKILENYKPELLTEDEKDAKKEKEKTDKPDSQSASEEASTATTTPPAPEPPKVDKSEIDKITESLKSEVDKITSDLKKQLSLLRGSPPKGVESDHPVEKAIITKNLFETRV